MFTTTHEKKIKVHTIQIDDTEVLRYQQNLEDWIELLDSLLIAEPTSNGDGPAPTRRAKTKSNRAKKGSESTERIPCPKCGMLVKPRGLMIHQNGLKCAANAIA